MARKPKLQRYRFRVKLSRWEPTHWATNDLKTAQAMADAHANDPEAQVWDYHARKAL